MYIPAIFWLTVAGAIVVATFMISRTRSSAPIAPHPTVGETPLQTLDRRLAAGEIEAEDYKRARELLTGGDSKA